MHNILIVDDEAGIRDSLAGVLADEGYSASGAESGEACLDLLRKTAFDVVLLDIWLPGIDGLETLEKIRELENPPEVIMISGHGTIETAVRATKLGAYDFLEKPLSIESTLHRGQERDRVQETAPRKRRPEEAASRPRASSSATAFR